MNQQISASAPPASQSGDRAKVFVSYSRRDQTFAQMLVEALSQRGFDAFLDKTDIAPGEPWKERLAGLIAAADIVVFAISPDSIASSVCAWELEESARLNKRIVPIVTRRVADADAPPLLGRLNWIFCTGEDDRAAALAALDTALRTDLVWVREHTRLGELARRWDEQGRSNAATLRGADLDAAERWLDRRPPDANAPTALHQDFIRASRRAATTRQRGWVGGSLAVAIVALGLAGLAYWQREVAVTATGRAERNFSAAKTTVDSVIFELAQGLRDIEGMRTETVRRILARAEAAVSQLASRTENDPEIRRSQAAMYSIFADTYLRIGATALAADYARKAVEMFRGLVAAKPDNSGWQRDLSLGLDRLGKVYRAQGDRPGALSVYREALDISRTLAARDPDNADSKNSLSLSLKDIGQVLGEESDLAGALGAYREALDIGRALSASSPDNVEWQRNNSVYLGSIGHVLVAQGDLTAALAAYRESLDIKRAVTLKDPDNLDWRRDVMAGLQRIGELLLTRGDLTGALAADREQVEISRSLAAKDPGNSLWQTDLSAGLERVGDVLVKQGDLTGALAAQRENLAVRRALAARDPNNTNWTRDVMIGLLKVGDVLEAQNDIAGALAADRESLGMNRALLVKDPDNVRWQSDLVGTLHAIGNLLWDQSDLAGALASYREALDGARRLVAKSPDNTDWQRNVSLGLNGVGEVLLGQGDRQGALAAFQESLGVDRARAAKDPTNAQWQGDVAISLDSVGNVKLSTGDPPGALAAYRESFDIRSKLLAQNSDNVQAQRALSISYNKIGDALKAKGDLGSALKAYRDGLGIITMLLEKDKNNASWQNDLRFRAVRISGIAWNYIMARDFTRALEAANQAASLVPDQTMLYVNQAHALMFAGRTDEARTVYLQYHGEQNIANDKSWDDMILEDFADLRKAGLRAPLMDEIEKEFAS